MKEQLILQVNNITKIYKDGTRANDGISFAVNGGEVIGLLGHNGSGKTTLLNQIIGLSRPTQGSIYLGGNDAVADPDMARSFCSFQPQTQAPIDGITPRQAIEMMARIRGASRRRARHRADELLKALDIEAWANQRGDRLSGGVKRLTAFCMTAAEPGRVMMFDEPTNDVDPVRRRLLWEQIRALGDTGCAVLLVTHNVVEAERAVERLIILDKGRAITQGTPAQLRDNHSRDLRLELVTVDANAAQALVSQVGGQISGRRVRSTINAADVASAIAWAQRQQEAGQIEEFSLAPISLEDIYIQLVGANDHVPSSRSTKGFTDETLVS